MNSDRNFNAYKKITFRIVFRTIRKELNHAALIMKYFQKAVLALINYLSAR